MSSGKKLAIWIAVGLIAVGLGVAAWALISSNYRPYTLQLRSEEKGWTDTEQTFSREITSLVVEGRDYDVRLLPSDSEDCRVVIHHPADAAFSAAVTNGCLRIWPEEDDGISLSLFSGSEQPTITVYLPNKVLESLQIKTSSGDVTVPGDFTFGTAALEATSGEIRCEAKAVQTLTVKATSGDVTLKNAAPRTLTAETTSGDVSFDGARGVGDCRVSTTSGELALSELQCGALTLDTTSGDVTLRNVTAEGELRVTTTSGEQQYESCDAGALRLESTSGDVSGSLRSPKIFDVDTSSGDVDVPRSGEGGLCEIVTSSGDVRLRVAP